VENRQASNFKLLRDTLINHFRYAAQKENEEQRIKQKNHGFPLLTKPVFGITFEDYLPLKCKPLTK